MAFFWACEVSEIKATVVEVPAGFVLNACNATASSFPGDTAVSLGVETLQMDKAPWKGVVAHLGKPVGVWQVKLDLVFSQKVKFYLAKGAGKVHVSGYFQPGPLGDLAEDAPAVAAVGVVAPAAAEDAGAKKGKKRAREQSKAPAVGWDQTPSSDSETEEVVPKKQEKPSKPAGSKEKPSKHMAPKEKAAVPAPSKKHEKKPHPHPHAPTANGGANPAQPGEGKKKKKNKKHKKANAGAAASQ